MATSLPSSTAVVPSQNNRIEPSTSEGMPESFPVELITRIFSHFSPKDLFRCSGVNKQWQAIANEFLNLLEKPRGIQRPIYTRKEFIEKLKACMAGLQPNQQFILDVALFKSKLPANFEPNPNFPLVNPDSLPVRGQMYAVSEELIQSQPIPRPHIRTDITTEFSTPISSPLSSMGRFFSQRTPPLRLETLVDEVCLPPSLVECTPSGEHRVYDTAGQSYVNTSGGSGDAWTVNNLTVRTTEKHEVVFAPEDLLTEIQNIIRETKSRLNELAMSQAPQPNTTSRITAKETIALILLAATLYMLMNIASQVIQRSGGPSKQDL